MARTTGFKFPKLNKVQQTVDDLGAIEQQISALEEKAKGLRKRLYRCVGTAVDGNFFHARISEATIRRLDKKKLRRFLTEKQIDSCYSKGKTAIRIRITERELV